MSHSSRYVPVHESPSVDQASAKEEIQEALLTSLQRVDKHASKLGSKSGVYVGISGISMMYRYLDDLHLSLPSSIRNTSVSRLTTSISHSHLSAPSTGSCTAFLETSVGQATLVLCEQLNASKTSLFQPDIFKSCIQLLNGAVRVALQDQNGSGEVEEDGCEVLYGRAGLLYALLYLRSAAQSSTVQEDALANMVAPLVSDEAIRGLADDIIRRGTIGAQYYEEDLGDVSKEQAPKLMWVWHGKRYLCGAHGVAGILQILLSCPVHIIEPHLSVIYDTVEWLMTLQGSDGNWPHKASTHLPRQIEQELVQWCHGAPAIIILLSTIITQSSSLHASPSLVSSAQAALRRGADLVYAHGLLRKGVGLCHGVAGSVYALLAASDALSNDYEQPKDYLQHAMYLAVQATRWDELVRRGEMQLPDRPYSLYEGLAGMCCAWGEVLVRMKGRRGKGMVGYADLRRD